MPEALQDIQTILKNVVSISRARPESNDPGESY
jgi:hypothetical protein